MAKQGGEVARGRARGRSYPLNSRRLTAVVVNRIVKAFSLEISASLEDAKQIVEGKLIEMGREPQNVQVDLAETEGGVLITLLDESGSFLEIQPEEADGEEEERAQEGGKEADERVGDDHGHVDPDARSRESELEVELERLTEENTELCVEVSVLKERVEEDKQRYKNLCRLNCQQLAEHDDTVAEKESEIESLRSRIAELEGRDHTHEHSPRTDPSSRAVGSGPSTPRSPAVSAARVTAGSVESTQETSLRRPLSICGGTRCGVSIPRRGKAPPVDPFDGENTDSRFEDWLPTLERAATWNGWSEEEKLLQLAGHLRKRALQEWNLLDISDRREFSVAAKSLQDRLDPGSRTLAAQDFRHAAQQESESVMTSSLDWSGLSGLRMGTTVSLVRLGTRYYMVSSKKDSATTSWKPLLCLDARGTRNCV